MLREKWTWLALMTLAILLLVGILFSEQQAQRKRLDALEKYLPYVEPQPK